MDDLPSQLDKDDAPPTIPDYDAMRRGLAEAMAAAGETPERMAARDARMAELGATYPGQFAAIREEWDGARIIEPFLLAVAPDSVSVEKALHALAPELVRLAEIQYLMPPNRAMAVSLWVKN